nr:galactocerebrosidase-like [Biomphalaria glabrata]
MAFKNILIIAHDGGWDIAHDILKDKKKLAKSVYVIGFHYPRTYDSLEAYITGKSLWAPEDYSTCNAAKGGGCWARHIQLNLLLLAGNI